MTVFTPPLLPKSNLLFLQCAKVLNDLAQREFDKDLLSGYMWRSRFLASQVLRNDIVTKRSVVVD